MPDDAFLADFLPFYRPQPLLPAPIENNLMTTANPYLRWSPQAQSQALVKATNNDWTVVRPVVEPERGPASNLAPPSFTPPQVAVPSVPPPPPLPSPPGSPPTPNASSLSSLSVDQGWGKPRYDPFGDMRPDANDRRYLINPSVTPERATRQADNALSPLPPLPGLANIPPPPPAAPPATQALHDFTKMELPPLPPPPPPPQQAPTIPMSPLDFARTKRVLERYGYHPVMAALLAPYYWGAIKGAVKGVTVDDLTMMRFMPQLPTSIRTRYGAIELQPPGAQFLGLNALQQQQTHQERAWDAYQRLMEAKKELALQQALAEAEYRQGLLGANVGLAHGMQGAHVDLAKERMRQAGETARQAISGLGQHPPVTAPPAPYRDISQGYAAEQLTKQLAQQFQQRVQAALQQIFGRQDLTDEQKQQIANALQSVLLQS